MNSEEKLTMQQAQEEMNALRMVFPFVALFNEDNLRQSGNESVAPRVELSGSVVNCAGNVAQAALSEKTQISKLEFVGSDIYQVIAHYVEIDGKPSVIEMVKKISGDSLVYLNGREELAERLARNSSELYLDALTGA